MSKTFGRYGTFTGAPKVEVSDLLEKPQDFLHKTVTIEGTVKAFKWGNPHSWLEVEVPNTKGGADLWNFEMNPPAYLVRSGWKSTSVKAGDKVKVTGRPFISGDPGGIFTSLTLANGQVLGAGAQPTPVGGAPQTQPPAQPTK